MGVMVKRLLQEDIPEGLGAKLVATVPSVFGTRGLIL
jgi:hypothetical protein